jgi:hypothetical protein
MPRLNLKLMTDLATAYANEPVRCVECVLPSLGEATWEDGLTIKLHPVLAGAARHELLHAFLHECGHVVCGHVYRGNVAKYDNVATQERIVGRPLPEVRGLLARYEREADAWAASAQERLEASHPGVGGMLVR